MAKTLSKDTLIAEFQTMLSEHWSYIWGKAEKGCVDCSGAFVYAFRQHGMTIAHGSNAIARKYIIQLLPISEARAGMAAFKLRRPGEGGWELPEKYSGDPDQNDYYHIGLIDSDGKHVLNAQSTQAGFTRTDLSRWSMCGYLKDVDYDDADPDDQQEEEKLKTAIVTAPSGSTVNLRSAPSATAKLIDRLPVGSLVDVLEDFGEWMKISKGGKTGYMMSNYLEYSNAPDETAEIPAFDIGDLRHTLAEIAQLVNDMIGKVG